MTQPSVTIPRLDAAGATRDKQKQRPRPRSWRSRLNARVVGGGLVLLVIIGLAVFAPLVTPYSPSQQNILQRFTPPGTDFLLGSDNIGRDVFTRIIYGARISLTVGFLAIVVAETVGVSIGLLSGHFGGLVDNLLMRLTDALLSFPLFFLLLTVTTVFGRTLPILILVLGLTSWGVTARLIRAQVLSLKAQDFVLAARALGATHAQIMTRHLLPNIFAFIVVDAALGVAVVILVEGGLSFLGVGVQPPAPSWGNMIAEGSALLRRAWWMSFFPGITMLACTMSFSILADGVRDMLDPKAQKR